MEGGLRRHQPLLDQTQLVWPNGVSDGVGSPLTEGRQPVSRRVTRPESEPRFSDRQLTTDEDEQRQWVKTVYSAIAPLTDRLLSNLEEDYQDFLDQESGAKN